MEYTDKAAHTALTKMLPEFVSSNISPENLADKLQARSIIGKAAYEAARNKLNPDSNRRRDLLNNVIGCGEIGAFQDLVHILLEMCEWLGKKLIAAYLKEGGVWPDEVHVPAMYEGRDTNEGESKEELHQSGAPANDTHSDAEIDDTNLFNVLEELHPVAQKWKAIGEALHCPQYELDQIQRSPANYDHADFLREMLVYRMAQLNPSRLTWSGIVKALRVQLVGKAVLANKIAEKYCPAAVIKGKKDKPPHTPPSTGSPVVLQRKKASPTNGKPEDNVTEKEEINAKIDLRNKDLYFKPITIKLLSIGCVTFIVVFLLLSFITGKGSIYYI